MALSLYPQFETNMMSNRKVIEQLKSAKAHSKNYIKVKPHLVRHRLRNRLFSLDCKIIRSSTEESASNMHSNDNGSMNKSPCIM